MVNIIGDDNNVTINDIKELIADYQELKVQNDVLTAQSTEFYNELEDAKNKIEEYV